jgi:hypothetical protein
MMPAAATSRRDAGRRDVAVLTSFRELLEAYEFVSFGGGLSEHYAFVSRDTGKIYWQFDSDTGGEPEEPLPEDIDDNEKYLAVPNKRELDLGTRLVLNFAREVLPQDFDEIRDIFSRRGAYGAFKQLLIRRHARDRWDDYEQQATERALRDWCVAHGIELTD